jgi:hypothetical protein
MPTAMWMIRPAFAALLVLATGMPAFAHPIEIATLGRAPLIGQSTNASELKYNVKTHEGVVRRAALELGLTREQYLAFRHALDGTPQWVTIPRHLDAMTWQSGGTVHVVHDVIIPANQKGVEVDLRSGDRVLALFMPAACGNLSLIRRAVPHVAEARIRNFPVPHPAPVAAVPEAPPAAPLATEDVAAAPEPLAPAPPPTAIVAPAVHERMSLFPLLALIPALFGGGATSGGGSTTVIPAPPCPSGTGP